MEIDAEGNRLRRQMRPDTAPLPRGLFGGGARALAAQDIPAGYSPTAMTSLRLGPQPGNPLAAVEDFRRNFMDMRKADTIGGDKYFHCKANCEATKRGPLGQWTAEKLSNLREIRDQRFKNYPREDSMADQRANRRGRDGAEQFPQRSCRQICSPVRPNGLPGEY